ncbi:MAG: hypothetical protein KGL39_47560, partial [Patescibacteria group bacterium]|nr:hypothetical protein [Patescibacteria group bacterium]
MLDIHLTPEQMAVAKSADRFPVIAGGERAGKSVVTATILLPNILALPYLRKERFFDQYGQLRFNEQQDRPRTPDFLLFGPTYAEPRVEFTYLEEWLDKLGKLARKTLHTSKPQDGPWRMVTTDGVVISTFSTEDPTGIRAVDLEGAAICEAGKCAYDTWERVNGRVSSKRGFIILSGTIEDSQRWYVDYMLMGKRPNDLGLVSYSIPTWTNHHMFPGGERDPEILRLKALYPEETFLARICAEPSPPRYRVLKEVQPAIVCEPDIPGDAEWWVCGDPGYATAYAIMFVAIWKGEDGTKRFHFADELYERKLTTHDMIELLKAHPLWAKVRDGVLDVASKGHRDASESALEIFKKKTSVNWRMKWWPEDRLIERLRASAKSGQFTISPKCKGFLMESGIGEPVFPDMGTWTYLVDRDGRIQGEKPV